MRTFGNHWLVEYFGCEHAVLDDPRHVEEAMREAAVAAGATVLTTAFHRFAPQGVSGVVVIAESHLSIHTWPEHGYAAVDFYTCGACEPERACQHLREALGARRTEIMRVQRGHDTGALSMRVAAHHREDGPSKAAAFAEEKTERSTMSVSARARSDDELRPGSQRELRPAHAGGHTMAITLNHTIVPARDKVEAARFFAGIFGLTFGGVEGHFAPVKVNDALTFDFGDDMPGFEPHHYAFLVSDEEFDAIFGRVQAAGVPYASGPDTGYDNQISHYEGGGRRVYFPDPNNHFYELMTRA